MSCKTRIINLIEKRSTLYLQSRRDWRPAVIGTHSTRLRVLQNPHEADAKILPWRTLDISGLLAGLNHLLTRSCLAAVAMQRSIK